MIQQIEQERVKIENDKKYFDRYRSIYANF